MSAILVSSLNEAVSHRVFVGIGSNIERETNINHALSALRDKFGELLISKVYETEAMESLGADQYFNLVVGFDSPLSAAQTNQCLKAIEASAASRQHKVCPLDIDLLLFDALIQHDEQLDIPRRDIVKYAYVAVPLAEVNPDQTHPETGMTFKDHSQSDTISAQNIWPANFHEGKVNVS